jgi:hypothetical protein
MDENVDVLKRKKERQFNRKLVVLVHVLAAFFTLFIYLSDLDLRRFPYWYKTSPGSS